MVRVGRTVAFSVVVGFSAPRDDPDRVVRVPFIEGIAIGVGDHVVRRARHEAEVGDLDRVEGDGVERSDVCHAPHAIACLRAEYG